ncbi:MAG: hypothetical protein KPEEDBHJ_00239 [Anaerolineales bacterium]|nr:hypothetical protein [Anaerolineales bacterium]
MNRWTIFNEGRTIGRTGAEGGLILSDEEVPEGARITLKRGSNFVSVSLNIYGWMDHTRFFASDADAMREYRAMKPAALVVLNVINTDGVNDIKIWEAISEFVRRFP